jgi:hypothetical protein
MGSNKKPYYQNEKFYYNPLDREIDLRWAGRASDTDNRFSNYYDYYFSGEDIRIFIDGLFGPEDEMDVASFAYSIRQEKQPLYGFWSYNYDAVMYGTRIISGEISLYTRYPRRMTEFLEKAATIRSTEESARNGQKIISRMSPKGNYSTDDELNVQKYWAYSQLDRITLDPASSESKERNIFSAHPPFNFVILYGAEETALSPLNALTTEDYFIDDNLDRMIYSDVNQRSIKVDNISNPMKVIIQQVQLMNMTTAYGPGGQAITENYQFIARDHYFSQVDLSFVKTLETSNVSDSDTSSVSDDSSTSTGYGGGGTAGGTRR